MTVVCLLDENINLIQPLVLKDVLGRKPVICADHQHVEQQVFGGS
jgi:hypothetical protein